MAAVGAVKMRKMRLREMVCLHRLQEIAAATRRAIRAMVIQWRELVVQMQVCDLGFRVYDLGCKCRFMAGGARS